MESFIFISTYIISAVCELEMFEHSATEKTDLGQSLFENDVVETDMDIYGDVNANEDELPSPDEEKSLDGADAPTLERNVPQNTKIRLVETTVSTVKTRSPAKDRPLSKSAASLAQRLFPFSVKAQSSTPKRKTVLPSEHVPGRKKSMMTMSMNLQSDKPRKVLEPLNNTEFALNNQSTYQTQLAASLLNTSEKANSSSITEDDIAQLQTVLKEIEDAGAKNKELKDKVNGLIASITSRKNSGSTSEKLKPSQRFDLKIIEVDGDK